LANRYIITLLANLNARSPQPTPVPTKAIERIVVGRRDSGGGVLSFLRSVVRTIRHDLTSGPNEARAVEEVEHQDEETQIQAIGYDEGPAEIEAVEAGPSSSH